MTDSLTGLMGGILLLCAFWLLNQRRLAAMVKLYQIQSLALCAAAFAQSLARQGGGLYLTGIIILACNGLLLPFALRALMRHFKQPPATPIMPLALSLLLGLGLTGLAVLVVLPGGLTAASLTRENLAIALAVILLGLLMMTTRRDALVRIIGFLGMENGVLLAAIGMPGMPFLPGFAIGLLVLAAALAAAVFLRLRTGQNMPVLSTTAQGGP